MDPRENPYASPAEPSADLPAPPESWPPELVVRAITLRALGVSKVLSVVVVFVSGCVNSKPAGAAAILELALLLLYGVLVLYSAITLFALHSAARPAAVADAVVIIAANIWLCSSDFRFLSPLLLFSVAFQVGLLTVLLSEKSSAVFKRGGRSYHATRARRYALPSLITKCVYLGAAWAVGAAAVYACIQYFAGG